MHNARLSHAQLKQLVDYLLAKGLVFESERKLNITDKGREYLKACLLAETILQS